MSDVRTAHPVRVQLSRSRGWRMPSNTVRVDRTTQWGNPFIVAPKATPGAGSGVHRVCVPTVEDAVECFRLWLAEQLKDEGNRRALAGLRGKNLACWCPIGSPCHADLLLEIAND